LEGPAGWPGKSLAELPPRPQPASTTPVANMSQHTGYGLELLACCLLEAAGKTSQPAIKHILFNCNLLTIAC
jgi:hypothetical protein